MEDSEDLKVSVTELQEQLEMSEEASISMKQVAQQARNENGPNIFDICRQGEEDVGSASLASWNAQLKHLVELFRRCQDTMQEVILLSERQKIQVVADLSPNQSLQQVVNIRHGRNRSAFEKFWKTAFCIPDTFQRMCLSKNRVRTDVKVERRVSICPNDSTYLTTTRRSQQNCGVRSWLRRTVTFPRVQDVAVDWIFFVPN